MSIWGENDIKYGSIDGDRQTNVLVIGAGIAGLTCAYNLLKLGKKVIVLEKDRIGSGDSGLSTGFLTYLYDVSIQELLAKYDDEIVRQLYVDAKFSIDFVHQIIQDEQIDCDFEVVDNYLISNDIRHDDLLQKEREIAVKYGLDYKQISPFDFAKHRTTIKIGNQAKFNPLKYMIGLSKRIVELGGIIYEKSYASQIKKDKEFLDLKNQKDGLSIKTNNGIIKCEQVILCVGMPGAFYPEFEKKFEVKKTFVVKGKINSTLPKGLYVDTNNPYNYFRIDENGGEKSVIFGGCDQLISDVTYSSKKYELIVENVQDLLDPTFHPTNSWSGIILNPIDLIPYIGEYKKNIFIMTGFGGNGLTYATLGANIISQLIVNGKSPFNHNKYAGEKILEKALTDNIFTIGLKKVLPWLDKVDVRKNYGKVINLDGKKVAVYTDENGIITKLSPFCTHLGCQISWNNKEKTWDCPCHESRFDKYGKRISGPAKTDLEMFE